VPLSSRFTDFRTMHSKHCSNESCPGNCAESGFENGAESGRGLRIVAELSLRWGFHEDGDRTIVWAEFPGPTGP
jgi:hypothetical protein